MERKKDEVFNVVNELVDKSPPPDGMSGEDISEILDVLRGNMFNEDRKKVQKKIFEILDLCADKAYQEKGKK